MRFSAGRNEPGEGDGPSACLCLFPGRFVADAPPFRLRTRLPRGNRSDSCLSARDRTAVCPLRCLRATAAGTAVGRSFWSDLARSRCRGAGGRPVGYISNLFPGRSRRGRILIRKEVRRSDAVRESRIHRILRPSSGVVGRSQEQRARGSPAVTDLSQALPETIKVLFASGSEDLIPTAIEHMQKLFPELPLVVASEFPIEGARWIPYPLSRGFWENLALFRWHFRDKRIRLSAVILQPRMPYWRMRMIAFALAPWNFLAFNEDFGHFMLRPQTIGTVVKHLLWRTRNFFVWEFSPGGATYTWLWRLGHPSALARPSRY